MTPNPSDLASDRAAITAKFNQDSVARTQMPYVAARLATDQSQSAAPADSTGYNIGRSLGNFFKGPASSALREGTAGLSYGPASGAAYGALLGTVGAILARNYADEHLEKPWQRRTVLGLGALGGAGLGYYAAKQRTAAFEKQQHAHTMQPSFVDEFTTLVAAAEAGVPLQDAPVMLAAGRRICVTKSAALGKTLAQLGGDIMRAAGRPPSFASAMFDVLAASDDWSETHWDKVAGVVEVLSRDIRAAQAKEVSDNMEQNLFGVMTKQANPLLAALGLASPAARSILWAALGTGAAAGTGMWALNRNLKTDNMQNESLKARIQYYNAIADELEEKARRKRDGNAEVVAL